jgi:hypothetical protein
MEHLKELLQLLREPIHKGGADLPFLGLSSGMYGWTEKYFRPEENEPAWDVIFKACAECGMDAVELDPSPRLVQLARAYGLSVSGSYLGLPLHEKELQLRQRVVPFAEMLAEAGGRDLVINADPKGGFASPLKKTGMNLNSRVRIFLSLQKSASHTV